MNRVLLTLVISLVAYSGAVADVVVSKGETVHLGLPDGEGPWLRFSLAYLTPNGGGIDPTAAIGAWFDGAGLYDLSNDPHLPGFLDRATNGTMDWMVASLNDQHGHGWNIEYWEGWIWLGQYPDLAPLQITGAQLVVEQVQRLLGVEAGHDHGGRTDGVSSEAPARRRRVVERRRAEIAVAVADAVDDLKNIVDYITPQAGGKGAVRHIIELIMKEQGSWKF